MINVDIQMLAIYNAIYKFGKDAKLVGKPIMERKAKVFYTNRSQAVRLPKDFQFNTDEVFIHREGQKLILSPIPSSWDDYLKNGPVAPVDFMTEVEDLPVQERSF